MDEARLKDRFDKEISAPDRELLWEWLKDKGDVDDACNGPGGWEEFDEEANKLAANWQWRLLGRNKPPGREPRYHEPYGPIEVEITAREAEHAAALAPYLARRAACLPEVRRFRKEKLDGGTLDLTQVPAFLRSELGYLPRGEVDDLEFVIEQVPSILGRDEETELMDLVGGSHNRSSRSAERFWRDNFRRAVEFESASWSYEPTGPALRGIMHLIRDEGGRTLEDLARWLVARYPWPLRDAAWFVLTGRVPEIEPLRIEPDEARGTYRITFATWISEESLRRAYRSLHKSDNRPLGRKVLSAFRFVDERTEPGRTPKWAELTREWNQRCKKRNREDLIFYDGSALKRAYERVEKRLASPFLASGQHRAVDRKSRAGAPGKRSA